MASGDGDLTAFGRWVREQPRGTLSQAMHATGLAWTTVHRAQFHRVSTDTAILLVGFTKGRLKLADVAIRPKVSVHALPGKKAGLARSSLLVRPRKRRRAAA